MYVQITPNGPVQCSLADVVRENPNTSFPLTPNEAVLLEFGVYPLLPTDAPIVNPATQVVIEAPPAQVNGQWRQQWAVRDLTMEELKDRVPRSVSRLQGLRVIAEAGLAADFLAWKAALDPVADFADIAFLEGAQNWVYDDPLLNSALVALGVADQKDALFTWAGTL